MKNSHIEWTDHTFNPWWGCMKVSEGCKNCYAATLDNRYHKDNSHWGPGSSRKEQSDKYWLEPLKWDKVAEQVGIKAKVFCASMADVFESNDYISNPDDVVRWRERLFTLIEMTPHLIWQLLTKRPENITAMIPDRWNYTKFPDNVWIGTSIENQSVANERIPHLLKIPAKVRFLSCEPLLGPVDLFMFTMLPIISPIHWVITGGESGNSGRPMHPEWPRSLKDQCEEAEIPFFFKQWGEYSPWYNGDISVQNLMMWSEESFKLVKYPHQALGSVAMVRMGKKESGDLLDGVEYKNFPI